MIERLTLRISRADAKARGLRFYYSGEPCQRGHRSKRYVSTRACVECQSIAGLTWQRDHHEQYRAAQAKHWKAKYAADPNYRIGLTLYRVQRRALRGSQPALSDIGCSLEELRNHIQSQFTGNMRWDNMGSHWVLGHIKSVRSFDLTDRKQYLEACNWRNIRPQSRGEFYMARRAR